MVTTKTFVTAAALTATLLAAGCGQAETSSTQTTTAAPPISSAPPRGTTSSDTPSSTTSPSKMSTSTTGSTQGRPTTAPATAKGTPRGPLPEPDRVDQSNAAAVAVAYVRTAETIDTRIDNSRNDAQRRAARWLTADLAQELAKGLPGGAGWAELEKKSAWTKAEVTDVTPSGGDPTAGLTSDRVLQVEVTTYGRGRKAIGAAVTTTTAVTLQRASESKPWRVSDMQTY